MEIHTRFRLVGDFTVTAKVIHDAPSFYQNAGLVLYSDAGAHIGNVTVTQGGSVGYWHAASETGYWKPEGVSSATVRFARTNGVVFVDYQVRNEAWVNNYSFSLATPVSVSLSFYVPTSDPSVTSAQFDDLSIQSDDVIFITDSDGDSVSNYDEVNVHHTDPDNADTDGDGFADGTEVKYKSDPNNSASIPEIVNALPAVELEFITQQGKRYQVQSSPDLSQWTDSGDPFDGTGGRTYRLVSTRVTARTFWRLKVLP